MPSSSVEEIPPASVGASNIKRMSFTSSGGSFSWSMQDVSMGEMGSDEFSIHSRMTSSSNPKAGGGGKSNKRRQDEDILARKETRDVNRLRLMAFFVLAATAIAVCILAYNFTSTTEKNHFATAYYDQADRVMDGFQINAQKRVGAMKSLALSVTSYTKFSNSSWPLVTVPDFERRGRASLQLADAMSIVLLPLVADEARNDWESYSVNNQGWLEESIQAQTSLLEERKAEEGKVQAESGETVENNGKNRRKLVQGKRKLTSSPIIGQIHRLEDGLTVNDELGLGPYLPLWQIAPTVSSTPSLVNSNLLSHVGYRESLAAALQAQAPVIGQSFEFTTLPLNVETAGRRELLDLFLPHWLQEDVNNVYHDDPVADLHVPLYEKKYGLTSSASASASSSQTLVGFLSCTVYWRTYFANILPENAKGIMVVLENTCDQQQYTYQINGPDVLYLGVGDMHQTKYNHFQVKTSPRAFLQLSKKGDAPDIPPGSCLYEIHVYPSQEMENLYRSSGPVIYTSLLAFIFLFTSAVFVGYDCLVEKRQRVVMSTAVASSAIVSSLFPDQVIDRLYNKDNNIGSRNVGGGNGGMEEKLDATKARASSARSSAASVGGNSVITARRLIKNFLTERPEQRQPNPQQKEKQEDGKDTMTDDATIGGGTTVSTLKNQTKPIADLFPNCTVLFADISGFTAWSSNREPTDVFKLLETLYGEFDKLALKRRVFKVETIGDCYLAVTGLPEPQKDHAMKMCLFAYECMRQMKKLMSNELRDLLGGNTGLLSMRFGLHSGPVTAGVLRGEKSRFQLFGDTVNFAARMESTGTRDRIQLSQATADLLIQAGKSRWVHPRKDVVQAKDTGQRQTYWLDPRKNKRPSHTSTPNGTFRKSVSNGGAGVTEKDPIPSGSLRHSSGVLAAVPDEEAFVEEESMGENVMEEFGSDDNDDEDNDSDEEMDNFVHGITPLPESARPIVKEDNGSMAPHMMKYEESFTGLGNSSCGEIEDQDEDSNAKLLFDEEDDIDDGDDGSEEYNDIWEESLAGSKSWNTTGTK